MKVVSFKNAPVGARFKYPNTNDIFVKINSYPKGRDNDGNGLIVSWNGNTTEQQSLYPFTDTENGIDFDTIIELI